MHRWVWAVLLAAAVAGASAQIEEKEGQGGDPNLRRLDKSQERKTFHPPRLGPTSDVRMRGWAQRQKLLAESPFQGLAWRSIGPEVQGGRVADIETPAGRPGEVLVGFATGGLYRTKDDGITWESLFNQESAFGIGAFAVSRDGKTIWVGSGEANSQRTSYPGTGVFRSDDAGKTWKNVGLPESSHIGRIVIDPRNEKTVWVAALGRLYTQNPERGVYKTTDGGATWQLVLKVDAATGAVDLALDPRNPDVVWAAMYERERRAWNFLESGPGTGIYKSVNGGKSWQLQRGLPHGLNAGRYGIAISASQPSTMAVYLDNQENDPDWQNRDEFQPSGELTPRRFLLLTEETLPQVERARLQTFWTRYAPSDLTLDAALKGVADKTMSMTDLRRAIERRSPNAFQPDVIDNEIYLSRDSGKTWKRIELGDVGGGFGYYFGKVFIHPKRPDEIWAGGVLLIRSKDGGKSWQWVARRTHVDHHALLFDPRDPDKVWLGNDGGVYLSGDDGETWRHLNNLNVAQSTTLGFDFKVPYNVYTGMQDNGTARGPSNYRPGISDLGAWVDIGGGDGSAIAVDPRGDGDIVFAASQFGAHFGLNQRTNERWSARPAAVPGRPPLRFNWISPIVISTHHPDIVYVGSQFLHRSFNQGRRYEAISPDLTKNLPNGDVPFSTIKDISESPLRFGLIYTGADDGRMMMTPDGGHEWIEIPTPAPDKWISRVVASRYDVGTVYVAQSGYRDDDFTPYLWKSTDFGKTWTSIVGNLPAEPINAIREDPERKDLLYVATGAGVYVSFNGGGTWEALAGGMPTLPVHDILVHPREKDLVAATHARGIWILPLKWVYALTPEIRAADLTVLELPDVRRSARWGLDSRSTWDTSPPTEPRMTGMLFARAGGKGTIRIKDKDGKVVREGTFDATPGFNTISLGLETKPQSSANRIAAPREIKTVQDALADPFAAQRAQYVPVGDYTVEIAVAGKTVSRPWKVTS